MERVVHEHYIYDDGTGPAEVRTQVFYKVEGLYDIYKQVVSNNKEGRGRFKIPMFEGRFLYEEGKFQYAVDKITIGPKIPDSEEHYNYLVDQYDLDQEDLDEMEEGLINMSLFKGIVRDISNIPSYMSNTILVFNLINQLKLKPTIALLEAGRSIYWNIPIFDDKDIFEYYQAYFEEDRNSDLLYSRVKQYTPAEDAFKAAEDKDINSINAFLYLFGTYDIMGSIPKEEADNLIENIIDGHHLELLKIMVEYNIVDFSGNRKLIRAVMSSQDEALVNFLIAWNLAPEAQSKDYKHKITTVLDKYLVPVITNNIVGYLLTNDKAKFGPDEEDEEEIFNLENIT